MHLQRKPSRLHKWWAGLSRIHHNQDHENQIEHERIWEEAHEAAEKIQRGLDDNQRLRQQLREAEQRLAELSAADQQLGVPTQDQEVSESPADNGGGNCAL